MHMYEYRFYKCKSIYFSVSTKQFVDAVVIHSARNQNERNPFRGPSVDQCCYEMKRKV